MNRIENSFSRSAESYIENNYIQKSVAKELISKIDGSPKRVVDIGSGSGVVYSYIDWQVDKFLAIDFSEKMLELHPSTPQIEKLLTNFDKTEMWHRIEKDQFDLLISSSSLQWSRDLEKIFSQLNRLNVPQYISIFTSKTFQELHNDLQISSPIYSMEEIERVATGYHREKLDYQLNFSSRREALKYIRQSGVSGGSDIVSQKILKEFLRGSGSYSLSLEIVLLWKN